MSFLERKRGAIKIRTVPDMKNELFTIGPFTVYGYGTMIAIGIVAAYIMTEYRARKYKLAYEHVFSIVIWCAAGGFVSSKLLACNLCFWSAILFFLLRLLALDVRKNNPCPCCV